MSRTTFILVCILLLARQVTWSQPKHINFTSLTSKDGLLSSTINAITKDHYGLMWFATDDGLNKFDGTNFTVYRNLPGDSTSLRSNEILGLHEDKKGNLWIATSGGGLSLYNRKKDAFQHFDMPPSLEGLSPSAVIRGIYSDYLGKIWIAQFHALFVLDPTSGIMSKINLTDSYGTPTKTIFAFVFEDSKHRLWIGSDNGLFKYNRTTRSFKRYQNNAGDPFSLSNDLVKGIAEDKAGNIWVGTADGLCKLLPDESGFTIYRHVAGDASSLSDNLINCLAADADGLLWIGAGEGLNVFNTQTQKSTVYKPEQGNIHSLTHKGIKCAYIDKQGIYWFGTFRGGINKYDKNLNLFNLKLSSTFQENGTCPYIVSAFAEDRNGRTYVGTDGGGLYTFDPASGQLRRMNIPLTDRSPQPRTILAMCLSRDNKLYIGTYAQGVIIWDMATNQTSHLLKGTGPGDLNSNDIYCIKEDSKGNIWIGTNGSGINILYKNNKTITKYNPHPVTADELLMPNNGYIRAFEEDTSGNIWIGTHGGGLAVYEPAHNTWTNYNQDNSQLPSDKIQSMLRDSRGKMWVGTFGGGLVLFDRAKKQCTRFSEREGLQNSTIYQIVEDKQGRLWLSSNIGISSFDSKTNRFRSFTSYNGVQHNNFAHGSGIRLSNGELLFGGLQGFNYFDPAELKINHNVGTVLLTDLKISNKSVQAGDEAPIKEHISVAADIRLDYKQNFALSFVALNYTSPKQNYYAYKLEGFDTNWNYIGTSNTASYTNLDPGEYVFHVKASNNDGIWSTKDTLIKIYVKPPFWRTIYAYIFYVLVFGGLLLYSRYRGISRLRKEFAIEQERQQVKRMQELDRLKLKFLTNLSHDFRTPIALIMGPVDQLITDENTTPKLDKLHMIRRNARRLLNLVNQLLDFRKMEEHELKLQLSKGEFVSFVKEVSESFRDHAERKHIDFTFTSDITKLDALFDRDKIERILFNLLSNAFKFTLEGGAIGIELQHAENPPEREKKWVTILVKDSGIGIPEDKQKRIFDRFFQNDPGSALLNYGTGIGLSITKEFVRMHGGTIGVISEPGKGSLFTIQLPLTPAASAPVDIPSTAALDMAMTDINENGHVKELPAILLVEDNEDFRFYLKDNLRNNYRVYEAGNGKEGWQKALAHHPQIIVSDITMPEMDGISLVSKLKADKRTSHIPVILLTAVSGDQQQIRGLETGASDYITKPFNFEVLNAKIKSLLELKSTMESTYAKQIRLATPEVTVESADEKLLQDIAGYLETNLTNPQLSVANLSKQVGMSRSSLYSKVLELTGQTPVEYIRSFRLQKATALMEKSNMTIAEIAYQVGFTTPNYFARTFKSIYHMQPSEFIAKMRNEK